ncbi:MAG TPA: extracellular solute-binding protein [Actinoallomurus sp.]|nr:extracellular solute-binding protein [Actinoallomurus sp.]
MRGHRVVGVLCAAVVTLAGCGQGAGAGKKVAEVAQYTKADRTNMLVEGAKKEKKLVWYTTLIPTEVSKPLADAFHRKYPFVTVQLYRGDSNQVAQKFIQEYRARSYRADVVDGSGTSTLLRKAGFLQRFNSPELASFPSQFKDPDGYWGTELLYYMVLAYNTKLVPPGQAPRTYEDLLDPKWKGKMAWSTSSGSGAPTFVGNVLTSMGQDRGMAYLRRLAGQDIHNVNSSGRTVLDQAVAGQFQIALQVFNHQVTGSKAAGAPVDWVPLQPVTSQLGRISLAAKAAHPHAALLFLDFMFSKEGQQLISDRGDIPASPAVPAKLASLKPDSGKFTANYVPADQASAQMSQWNSIYQRLFVDGG